MGQKTSYFYDRYRDGKLSNIKSIGSYWALIAQIIDNKENLNRFVSHLDNDKEFKCPHRIPSLSYDHPKYDPNGDYWRGGVWSSTNYMVIKGLQENYYYKLAYEISINNVINVSKIFKSDETLYENYAPEYIKRGATSYPEYKVR